MTRLIIDLDLDRCCACGACAIACMDQNDIDTVAEMPLRKVFTTENSEKGRINYFSIACMHCTDAPCVMACPTGCIQKDEETGLTVYDNTNCIGCHSCSLACPYGALSFDEVGKMQKCDGCIVRLQNGLEPACIRTCTVNALSIVDEQDQKSKRLKNSPKRIVDLID